MGFHSEVKRLSEETSQSEIVACIQEWNQDQNIHGILIQLPLPESVNTEEVLAAVAVEKDADGFHFENTGRLFSKARGTIPCTPLGIMVMLNELNIPLAGLNAVVLGRSNIVGKPMAQLLLDFAQCTVTICHSKTKDIDFHIREADILISAIGKRGVVKKESIKKDAVIIDVGIHKIESQNDNHICGDIYDQNSYQELIDRVNFITPVPRGVGPMTIAMLLYNTYQNFTLKKYGGGETWRCEVMESMIKPAIRLENAEDIVFRRVNSQRENERRKNWVEKGRSAGRNPIYYKHLKAKEGAFRVLLIGGVHGNETEGVRFMHDFCCEFFDEKDVSPFEQELLAIPVMNPDGVLNHQRTNANMVDLNRNMPTKDWSREYTEKKYDPGKSSGSEPETRHLIEIIEDFKPQYIISFHSWKQPLINYNGPALSYAQKIAEKFDMEITEDIGYPTPGSLGTYAGGERQIPTIVLEFERGIPLESVYPLAKDAVIHSFNTL